MDEIVVSICIATYNQEDYIAEAIEGCLRQKTKYKTEILIRDDCSTDGTRAILEAYQKEYPDKIRLILEQENQYSKGIKIFPSFINYMRGKYMAINEGDDFWNDEGKLEKQIDFLESNDDYALVTSAAYTVDEKGKRTGKIKPRQEDTVLSTEELIAGNGDMIATNSMVFRSCFMKELPPFYYNAKVEDYPLIIFLSTKGKVYYLSEELSTYRTEAKGSWSRGALEGDIIGKKIERCEDVVNLLKEINHFYKGQYNEVISERIEHFQSNQIVLRGDYRELKKKYPKRYQSMMGKEKGIMFFKFHFPKLYLKIKRRM